MSGDQTKEARKEKTEEKPPKICFMNAIGKKKILDNFLSS
jgi:hypothetical protein